VEEHRQASAQQQRESDGAEEAASETRRCWVLYGLNTDALLTIQVYDSYKEAAEDVSQFDDVLVLPLIVPEISMGHADENS